MRVIVPHHSTQQATIEILNDAVDKLLAGAGNKNIQIVDQKKAWAGSVMSFSFAGKAGFISVPVAGTVTVDDANVTVECELPPLAKNFLGEEKVRATVEEKVRELLGGSS